MRIFVGAEYVIANALIAMKRENGVTGIALAACQEFGFNVQRYCLQNGIDALFLLSADSVSDAIYNFSDYFTLETVDGVEVIKINQETPVEQLEERFVGYLPLDVVDALLEQAEFFAKKKA